VIAKVDRAARKMSKVVNVLVVPSNPLFY
jgi:hypothetical protein